MPIYKAPVEDVSFLLNDVFQIDRYDNLPGFSDASADVREAILGEAAKLSEEVLQPLNRTGDLEGCTHHDDGSVTTPKGFKEAYKQVAEGGWLGLSAPTEYGGQGLPVTLSQGGQRIPDFGQHGVLDVWRSDHGRDRGADGARQARAEENVRAEDGGGRMDRHHEPDRAAMRHRFGPVAHQGGRSRPTAATRSQAPRSSFPRASTIWRTTSSIWCWRASRAHPAASRACRCSWCRKSWSMPTARWARATASAAARSSTRWASTAIRPA